MFLQAWARRQKSKHFINCLWNMAIQVFSSTKYLHAVSRLLSSVSTNIVKLYCRFRQMLALSSSACSSQWIILSLPDYLMDNKLKLSWLTSQAPQGDPSESHPWIISPPEGRMELWLLLANRIWQMESTSLVRLRYMKDFRVSLL